MEPYKSTCIHENLSKINGVLGISSLRQDTVIDQISSVFIGFAVFL